MPPSDGSDRLNGGGRWSPDAPPPSPKAHHRASPALWLGIALLFVSLALTLVVGPVATGQATLNGLVSAGYFALGAVGLTLIYGVLHLVNFAHGDMLTFGTYLALGATALGFPFWPAAVIAMIVAAMVAVLLDRIMWEPM